MCSSPYIIYNVKKGEIWTVERKLFWVSQGHPYWPVAPQTRTWISGSDRHQAKRIYPPALALTIDGLSLFLYPLGTGISGMCIKSDDIAVIAINSAMSRGRQRFTLAHELYHYKHGKSGDKPAGLADRLICVHPLTLPEQVCHKYTV